MISSQAMADGALAIDSNQDDQYGFAYDYPSSSEAKSRALQECGYGCSIVKTFSSGCGAYAADQSNGSSIYGWGTASSSSQKKNTALQACKNYGGSQYIVRVWGFNS